LLVVCCAVASLVPSDAHACSVVLSPQVLPALAPAPLNTHVWMRHPTWHHSGNRSFKPGGGNFDVDFVVRSVMPTAADIPITVREWSPDYLIELVPQSLLAANHRFEVWGIPRSASESPRLLASFQTGTTSRATSPPKPAFAASTRPKPTGLLAGDCGSYEQIILGGTPDEGEVLYAVWAATNGHIDWKGPPIAIAGPPTPGHPVRFDVYDSLRPFAEFIAWAQSSPHIGVRAMDVAGNLSEPVELDVR
jgi:hypothetical protein